MTTYHIQNVTIQMDLASPISTHVELRAAIGELRRQCRAFFQRHTADHRFPLGIVRADGAPLTEAEEDAINE